MDITKGQKKILIITSIIIGLFLIFYIFIYLPAKNTVELLKAELLQIEDEINTTKTIIGKDKPLESGLSVMQKQLEELDRRFPDSEEETLQMISNLAYKSEVNITSIKPQPKSLFLDKNGNMVRIGDKLCHKMPISMAVRSTYKKLGKFLEALRQNIPHLLTVEKLRIAKDSGQDGLRADINLTMYLLCEERK